MIVIGVDVHKQSLTALAVDEVGRAVAELTVGSSAELVAWSGRSIQKGCGRLRIVGSRQVRSSGGCLLPASRWCGCRRS
jgi:hypothetical protein